MTKPQRPRLQLVDPASTFNQTVLGLWAVEPPPADEVVFDVPSTPVARPSIWRVSLPATPGAATASLAQAEIDLEAAEYALDEALTRLDRFASGTRIDVDFGVGGSQRPKARLSAVLESPLVPGDVTFDVGEQPPGTWQEAGQQFLGYLQRLSRLAANYAWVETYGGERRIAWTVVGWTGALDTWWPADSRPEDAELHRRALNLALRSWATMMRMLVLAARGAVILSRAVATPLGPVLVVPAAWSFIQDVLVELHRGESNA